MLVQGTFGDSAASSLEIRGSSNRTLMPPGWLATAGLPLGERLPTPLPSLELRLPLFCTCCVKGWMVMLLFA